jgi:molybdate transport system substrate-binding protein
VSRQSATRVRAPVGDRALAGHPTPLAVQVRGRRALRRGLAVLCLLAVAAFADACTGASAARSTSAPAARPAVVLPAQTLTVFAAASLTQSFGELGKQFEASHADVRVSFNFAGSQQLSAQLEDGARADVFASANVMEMNNAVAAGTVVSGTQQTFAHNRLIVIFPQDNPAHIKSLADLGRPGVKLDLADKTVPVGQYALDMLALMSQDPTYGPGFRTQTLANIVSLEDSVKSVAAKVTLGEVDAGIVYTTDVTGSAAHRVGTLQIPDRFNRPATYPIAPLAHAPQPVLAQQFVDFVLSPAGQQVLAGYGFLPGH